MDAKLRDLNSLPCHIQTRLSSNAALGLRLIPAEWAHKMWILRGHDSQLLYSLLQTLKRYPQIGLGMKMKMKMLYSSHLHRNGVINPPLYVGSFL